MTAQETSLRVIIETSPSILSIRTVSAQTLSDRVTVQPPVDDNGLVRCQRVGWTMMMREEAPCEIRFHAVRLTQ